MHANERALCVECCALTLDIKSDVSLGVGVMYVSITELDGVWFSPLLVVHDYVQLIGLHMP